MITSKRKFGDMGEKIATKFLKSNGYKILQINYQKRIGEIDIVSVKNNHLHFIEVKTRTEQSVEKYGLPQEAVNIHKQKRLINTALFYLSENKYSDEINWQIDVIAITIKKDGKKAILNHIENAINYDKL
ncbi:MAG: YraN family protein [Patescibacteria group bacterium]|nr:YraN family protein [Patescibacteria group bacterium]